MESNINISIIINAISQKINEIFGDDYNIEDGEVKQGFEAPCFFIHLFNGNQKHYRQNRYKSELSFQIVAFAKDDDIKQLHEMAEGLYDIEYLTIENGDTIRCFNMNHRIEDGVLQFSFDIKNFIYKEKIEADKMENISVNEEVKQNA